MTGAPTPAVMTPSGSSAGEATVRAMTSARTSSAAPSKADTGSSRRWAGPDGEADEMRHGQAEEGDDAGHRDRSADRRGDADDRDAASPARRRRRHGRPRPRRAPARRAPRARRGREQRRGTRRTAATIAILIQVAPPRLPSVQKVNSRSCWSLATKMRKPMHGAGEAGERDAGEEQRHDRGAPVAGGDDMEDRRSRRSPPSERRKRQAETGDKRRGQPPTPAPKTIQSAAASAAPDETPTMPGSASGLRKRPCMTRAGDARSPRRRACREPCAAGGRRGRRSRRGRRRRQRRRGVERGCRARARRDGDRADRASDMATAWRPRRQCHAPRRPELIQSSDPDRARSRIAQVGRRTGHVRHRLPRSVSAAADSAGVCAVHGPAGGSSGNGELGIDRGGQVAGGVGGARPEVRACSCRTAPSAGWSRAAGVPAKAGTAKTTSGVSSWPRSAMMTTASGAAAIAASSLAGL